MPVAQITINMYSAGEKVVCINNTGAPELIEKEIYTVVCYCKDKNGVYGLILAELNPEDGYFCWRFRKLDHSFAENLLKELNEEFYHTPLTVIKI